MLVRLNLETRAYHADADSPWHDLLVGTAVTKSRYMQQLVRVYGFEAPLEAALAYTPHLSTIIELRPRFRSGLIAQDLLNLDISPMQIAEIPQHMIAPFTSISEALGWMYVSERATLIHDQARRDLVARLPAVEGATSYLSAYQGHVGARWDAFGEVLDGFAQTAKVRDQIFTAAHSAFRAAIDWYGRIPTSRRAS